MKTTWLYTLMLPCLLLSSLAVSNACAQKKIKQIVGWGKYSKKDKTSQKFFAYDYNPDGKLLRKQDFRLYIDNTYFYDKQGKLVKIEGYEGETSFTSTYVYGKKVMTEIMKMPDDRVHKTHTYLNNKGNKVEEKTYHTGKLSKRILYTYNKQDSVIGEMHYLYSGKQRTSYKVIYTYDYKTHLRTHKNEYDAYQQVVEQEDYTYNAVGQLLKISKVFPQRKNNDYNTTIEYQYQNGKLWQVINQTHNGKYKSVKIYKEGGLIRVRRYENSKLMELIDYQYVYF
ncbi:hypothetical protein [Microscilla marina]|nr:hypothetical protein [Microscilla marina]